MRKKLIIDTDPGIDDAIALTLAYFSDCFEIKLISTVTGNVNLEKTTSNAKKIVNYFDMKNISIAKGCDEPMIIKPITASSVHGENGLGGVELSEGNIEHKENSVYEMAKILKKEKVTIVAIGPLTNVAMLLKLYPEVKKNIEEIVIMGGSIDCGNMRPFVEFNIGEDPHAAHVVFNSDIKLTILPLEIGRMINIKIDHPLFNKMLVSYNKISQSSMYDSSAIMYLIEPTIFDVVNCFCDVEIQGKYTMGSTIIDIKNKWNLKDKNNNWVVHNVDVKKFIEKFNSIISKSIK